MTTTLIRGRYLVRGVSGRDDADVLDDAALVQRDGIVEAVGPYHTLRAAHAVDREFGGPDHVLLPGFVNAHHHVGMTPLQLGSPDHPLELWFASRLPARRPDYYLDTLYSAFEMVESGITTVQHLHGWVPGGPEAVERAAGEVMRAYADVGMRVSYSFALRDQNRLVYEPDADFVRRLPADLRPDMQAHFDAVSLSVEDQLALFRSLYASHGGAPRRRVQLAPANLHWCSDEALGALRDHARDFAVPMHMHLLETAYQKEYARRRTGGSAVRHLESLGLLGPAMTLGHGVWVTEEDVERIAASGTRICHNCSSNLRLRSGVAPLNEYQRRGVRVAIGLDEAGINDDRDMLQEMRMVLRVHRVPGMDDAVPGCAQVLRMATEDGALTTPYADEIGRLEPGRAADVVLVDWREVAFPFLHPATAPIDALIQRAKTSAVDTVFVAGEPIFERGRFAGVDKQDALRALAESMRREDTPEETAKRTFARRLFPHVKQFYEGYLADEQRDPFYRPSSRR